MDTPKTTASLNSPARRFLRTGKLNGLDISQLRQSCERLIRSQGEISLTKALALSRQYSQRAKPTGKELTISAERLRARYAHLTGAYREAERAYLTVRKLAGTNKDTIARVDRALIDIYMYLNKLPEAARRRRLAIKTFKKLGSTSDIAMTEVNYANILHRQDRHQEAEQLYARAARLFEGIGDHLAMARCFYNRANTMVQMFNFEEAERLYSEALQIYERAKCKLEATDCRYGLAWLWMLRGKYHEALLQLSACEEVFHELGQAKGRALCSLDRAEVFLSLNLYDDASVAAKRAESAFDALGLGYESAKSALFRARSEFELQMVKRANASLERARRGFRNTRNFGFVGVATLFKAQMTPANSKRWTHHLNNARRYFRKAQLPLWKGVADIYEAQLTISSHRRHAIVKSLSSNQAVRQVPHLYAQWQTWLGDMAKEAGHDVKARRHWVNAANRLDLVRAQLPPIELRNSWQEKLRSPHKRLVALAFESAPLQAAVWSERYKTAGIWATPASLDTQPNPARMRAQESLARLSQQVAKLSGKVLMESKVRGGAALAVERRLQRQLRLDFALMEAEHASQIERDDELAASFLSLSKEMPIVQFHIGEDYIGALIHRFGKVRQQTFIHAPAILDTFLRKWRFTLEAQSLGQLNGHSDSLNDEQELFSKLGEWLWQPLGIDPEESKVLLLPEGALANVPWAALQIDNKTISERHQIVQAPSLRHYVKAAKTLPKQADSLPILLLGGAGEDLPHLQKELLTLSVASGNRAVLRAPSTRADWPDSGDYAIWHYAGHASLKGENPFYSYFQLLDGPLFAADFRLKKSKVQLVTLAACRTGEQVAMPGEESTGIVRSLLEMGARNVIAGLWPVADDSTALWMKTFYGHFFGGGTILDSAAIAAAQVRSDYPSAYHWAAFTVFGPGTV